jgi:hypothetical protein
MSGWIGISRSWSGRPTVSRRRSRENGEGSIFPYRKRFAGTRDRKYVYGKDRGAVHDKWVKLHAQAVQGTVATSVPKVDAVLDRWLAEMVKPSE